MYNGDDGDDACGCKQLQSPFLLPLFELGKLSSYSLLRLG